MENPTRNPTTPSMSPAPAMAMMLLESEPVSFRRLMAYPPATIATAPRAAAAMPLKKQHANARIPRNRVAPATSVLLRTLWALNGMSSLQSHSSQNSVSGGFSFPQRGHLMPDASPTPLLPLPMRSP